MYMVYGDASIGYIKFTMTNETSYSYFPISDKTGYSIKDTTVIKPNNTTLIFLVVNKTAVSENCFMGYINMSADITKLIVTTIVHPVMVTSSDPFLIYGKID
jgi:hypothetical protein